MERQPVEVEVDLSEHTEGANAATAKKSAAKKSSRQSSGIVAKMKARAQKAAKGDDPFDSLWAPSKPAAEALDDDIERVLSEVSEDDHRREGPVDEGGADMQVCRCCESLRCGKLRVTTTAGAGLRGAC